jgi:L-lactate dehydrogenase (cytochrome)/(S)-mandelate dehydrogenase
MPVGIAPTGAGGLVRRNAELDMAEAAVAANVPFCLSGGSHSAIEPVAAIAGECLWYQLYATRDRAIGEHLIGRARAAGVKVLIVTVDVPVAGRRERNIRNGFTLHNRWRAKTVIDALRHPAWLVDFLRAGGLPMMGDWQQYIAPNSSAAEVTDFFNQQAFGVAETWEDIKRYRTLWPHAMVIKGLLHPEDVRTAAQYGADGVILSNHGGRQLDRAPPPITMLPSAVAAANGKLTLMVDSGVRRGSDVLVATALGASAAFVGRPAVYGVAAGGKAGVEHVLRILSHELENNLAQLGFRSAADLSPDQLIRRHTR